MTAEHFSPLLRRVVAGFGSRYPTVIVANSQASADAYITASGTHSKVKVGARRGELHTVRRSSPERHQFAEYRRGELGVSAFMPLVGVFGRLSEWKGQMVLLEAITGLPDTHAVLIGDALFDEHAYVDKLRARAAEPYRAGRVHFLGFRREIPVLMQAMTIIAHTSIAAEPFDLVIVEGDAGGTAGYPHPCGHGARDCGRRKEWLLVTSRIPVLQDELDFAAVRS